VLTFTGATALGPCMLDSNGSCSATFNSPTPLGHVDLITATFNPDFCPADPNYGVAPLDFSSQGTDSVKSVDCVAPQITACAPPQSAGGDGSCQYTPILVNQVTVSNSPNANCPMSVTQSPINVSGKGPHTITLTASNGVGTASCETTFTLLDGTGPFPIFMNGPNPMTLACGIDSYVEPGATATDNCDGSRPVTPSGAVDTSTPGTYTVTHDSIDTAGNHAAAPPIARQRTVNVVDQLPPTVTLLGLADLGVECGSTFTDPGATADDACAGHLAVTVTGAVDTTTVGQ
jgi:hypothetical protein